MASPARADIDQWTWKNPSDPTQGIVQSTTACPGGSGVSAVPNVDLHGRDLTQAYLLNAKLSGGTLNSTNLTDAYMPGATLTHALLYYANLSGGTLTGANLTGGTLYSATLTGAVTLPGPRWPG